MQIGNTITILPSFTLTSLRLDDLIGKQAVVVEIRCCKNKKREKIYGCWVKLSSPYMEEEEWFIPYSSIGSI